MFENISHLQKFAFLRCALERQNSLQKLVFRACGAARCKCMLTNAIFLKEQRTNKGRKWFPEPLGESVKDIAKLTEFEGGVVVEQLLWATVSAGAVVSSGALLPAG